MARIMKRKPNEPQEVAHCVRTSLRRSAAICIDSVPSQPSQEPSREPSKALILAGSFRRHGDLNDQTLISDNRVDWKLEFHASTILQLPFLRHFLLSKHIAQIYMTISRLPVWATEARTDQEKLSAVRRAGKKKKVASPGESK